MFIFINALGIEVQLIENESDALVQNSVCASPCFLMGMWIKRGCLVLTALSNFGIKRPLVWEKACLRSDMKNPNLYTICSEEIFRLSKCSRSDSLNISIC